MKVLHTKHIAVSRREIDDAITIKENSGAGSRGVRHVAHA
jgi:hypothetical protein